MIEALAWPVVGLILGVVAILVFRGPLTQKIEGITRAGKDGLSFERPQDAEQPTSETLSFEHLMNQPISASGLEREKQVTERLASLPLKTDAERIALLNRVVALVNVELEHTRIAYVIFGSQLGLLVRLAGTRSLLPRAEAEIIYRNAAAQFPELYKDRSFETWLAYLLGSSLIVAEADQIDITQYGLDFLKYLVDARLAYDRHG